MDKAENPHRWYLDHVRSKTGQIEPRGFISVSQALEDLNDGLNFLYCRPDDNYLETVVVKDNFSVGATAGQINENDLVTLMDDIAEFAGDSYHGDGRGDKEPQMFDINLVMASTSLVIFEAIFMHQAGLPTSTTDDYPYSDSWIYGQWGQNVSNQCSQEGANADAADLLRRDLRKNVAFRNKFQAYYFKHPYTVCFTGDYDDCFSEEIPITNYFPVDDNLDHDDLTNSSDITPDDNLYDLLLFYNHSGNSGYHTCLSSNEMNFHYDEMEKLAEDLLPNPSGNNVIAQIEVGYNLLASGSSTIFHALIAVKATKVSITEEEDIEPVELPDNP